MSALELSSGLLGKEYAKDAEAASDRHLHIRGTRVQGSGEATEGLWRISRGAVDSWTLRAGTEDDWDHSPACSALPDRVPGGPRLAPCSVFDPLDAGGPGQS